jgi:2'-hydroxyisoflavone reductase
MRLLLLGGPRFLGRAVIEAALTGGHQLTVFNRGTTNADLPGSVEHRRGNRDGDLEAIRSGTWDVVIDTCGYVPRVVRQSAHLLSPRVGRYVFISSVSVYASFAQPVSEDSPVASLGDPDSEDVKAHYGALKAACEAAIDEEFQGRTLHVRPGLIVGPHDPTGRFTYWPHRVRRGGETLVPGPVERTMSFVDVRDLADWIVSCAANGTTGTMNAAHGWRMGDILQTAQGESGVIPDIVPVSDEFLRREGVGEWMELPLWIDAGNSDHAHFMDIDASRAVAAGLSARPLADTVRATLQSAAPVTGVGLTPEREAELLARWRADAV